MQRDHEASGSNTNSCLSVVISHAWPFTRRQGATLHIFLHKEKSRVRQRARRTLLFSTLRLSCAHKTSSSTKNTRTDTQKRTLHHVPHVPQSIFAQSSVNNYTITLTVPSPTSCAPTTPKSGERLPLDIEALSSNILRVGPGIVSTVVSR